MQVCKFHVGIFIAICIICNYGAFSQSSSSPAMPSMPSMPSITSVPTFSQSFYTPGGNKALKKGDKADTQGAGIKASEEGKTSLAVEKAFGNANLSAIDISSLGNLGLLGNLTSSNDAGNSSSTVILLQQILNEISELKKQVANQNAGKIPSFSSSSEPKSEMEFSYSESPALEDVVRQENVIPRTTASLLRFIVNGYSILSTCRTVYVSEPQIDGSFLVTGDRRYLSDGSFYTETFYLLFHPIGTKNGNEVYEVALSVSQDKPNPYSYVHQLSAMPSLEATRTGNLVSLHRNSGGKQVDILLDIGTKR